MPEAPVVDLEDDGEEKSEIMLISQSEKSEGNEKDRKESEKTQFNEIIDSMMGEKAPPGGSTTTIKEEENGSNPENMINNLMLSMRLKAKANEEAKKMLKRKDDKATLEKDTTNSNLERESDGNQSGNLESESEGGKSGKRKRKLFNSFCDDLMDENGEVHPQVSEAIHSSWGCSLPFYGRLP